MLHRDRLGDNTHIGSVDIDLPDIIISSKELPEVVAWKNRQQYRVTITYTKLIQSKRGQLQDVEQTPATVSMKAKLPVAEMIGLASDLRSATEGRGTFSIIDQSFEKIPRSIQDEVVKKVRGRKGLAENE